MRSILMSALLFAAVLFPSIPTLSQNSVWAWGGNSASQLGDLSWGGFSTQPVWVFDISDVSAISAGSSHSVALKEDGTVWDWGYCLTGSSYPCWSYPRQVSGISDVAAIAAGGDNFSLALKNDGTVWRWDIESPIPTQVPDLNNVVSVAAGFAHCLAVKSNGTVWAWGSNYSGQLGDGTNENRNIPVQTLYLSDVIAVVGGRTHSLAFKSDGTVWAWGGNYYGQLGDGTNEDKNIPIQASGLSSIIALSAGGGYALALKEDGTVWAWGNNYNGQLGDGTKENKNIPVKAMNISDVQAISAGYNHSLALKNDGTVWAWGGNQGGQLGDGTQENRDIPVQASTVSNAIAISAGGDHSLSILPKAITPPTVASIQKLTDPFRLKISGSDFNKDIVVFIGYQLYEAWDNVSYKNEETIILKKGKKLKKAFPEGQCTSIRLLNPDGGYTITVFKRN